MSRFYLVAAVLGFVLVVAATAASAGDRVEVAQVRITPVDEMNPEMRRAYIVGIQEELAAHGYRPGPADGVLGQRSIAAIRAYQHDAKLPVTGIASKELLDHMKFVLPKVYARGAAPPAPDTSLVYVGLVEETQIALQKRGYYPGAIDGDAGPQTRAAISQFQADAGLPVTGTSSALLLRQLLEADPSINRTN
jgi:peptidoglycan hydrolase-like protein with peptidoglycan-binding domain